MSTIHENVQPENVENNIIQQIDIERGSEFVFFTYYLNILVSIVLLLASFFFYTFHPENGFYFLYISIVLLLVTFGVNSYDVVASLLLLIISFIFTLYLLFTGIAFSIPFTSIYFLVFILIVYTFMIDKKTRLLYQYYFNKDLALLYAVIFIQYSYIIFDGFHNILTYLHTTLPSMVLFYSFLVFVFLNTMFVQKLNFNGRRLMYLTSSLVIIYSLLTLESDITNIIGVIINIVLLLVLTFDKKSIQHFKKSKYENNYAFRIAIIINVIAIFESALGLLYIYSSTLDITYFFLAIFFTIFYIILVYKVGRYSIPWKYIMNVIFGILLILSIIYFRTFSAFSLVFFPTAIVNLFVFNLEYQTINYFKKMNTPLPDPFMS